MYSITSKLFLFEVVVIVFLFSSCNLFFSALHGRENINDASAQITVFTAVPSSDNSVLTMWNWKEPPSWLGDERISEIHIQHSILGYPENYIFFAGETFKDISTWQYEWSDLDFGETHYFSLFAKSSDWDGNDIWYAPLKAKVNLPGTVKSGVFGFSDSYQVDSSVFPYVESKSISVSVDNSASPSVLVVGLDLPDNIYVTSATIETGAAGGIETSLLQLRVFPVSSFWDGDPNSTNGYYQLTDNTKDDYVVDDSVSAVIGTIDPTTNDITNVIRKALIYTPKQIVFKIDGSGGTVVDVHNPLFINIEYIE